jgi:hypothetical protein
MLKTDNMSELKRFFFFENLFIMKSAMNEVMFVQDKDLKILWRLEAELK